MEVTFVCFGFENIGVEYLSACLKDKGHKTSLVFDPLLFSTYLLRIKPLEQWFDLKNKLVEKIIGSNTELLAFSVMTDNYKRACEIAGEVKLRRRDLPIVFGGMHPTSVPDLVISQPFVDFVCVGEGEEAIVELADVLENGGDIINIANIWSKQGSRIYPNPPRPLLENLNLLPFPDKELFRSEFSGFNRDVYRVNVGRGCLLSCSFCSNSLMKDVYSRSGYRKRKRSVDRVVSELKQAKEKYHIKHILVIDDWFTDDLAWLEEFSVKYKSQVGLSFACDVYPGTDNERVIPLLENSGCTVVSLGIQTYSEALRKSVLHRYDSNPAITRTLNLLRKTRIFTYADFIIGIPGQDEKELFDIADFINKNRVDFVFSLWLRYYPKTAITQMAADNRWITEAQIKEIEAGVERASYFDKGMTYRREAAKLAGFLSVIPLLPRGIVGFLLKKKAYKWLPKTSFFYFRLMSVFVVFIRRITKRKNGIFYFSMRENFVFFLSYMFRGVLYWCSLKRIFYKR